MKSPDIEKILIDEQEIDAIVRKIASDIDRDYGEGGKYYDADRKTKSSYKDGSVSTGTVNIILDLHRNDIADLDILIIEDIIDSGNTLSYLCEYLRLKGAHSVRTCTLLDKPERREVEFTPDYCGQIIPDEFVVGYGLDYAERYRALPYVGILSPSVYMKN